MTKAVLPEIFFFVVVVLLTVQNKDKPMYFEGDGCIIF